MDYPRQRRKWTNFFELFLKVGRWIGHIWLQNSKTDNVFLRGKNAERGGASADRRIPKIPNGGALPRRRHVVHDFQFAAFSREPPTGLVKPAPEEIRLFWDCAFGQIRLINRIKLIHAKIPI